jgi:hypothetical protein
VAKKQQIDRLHNDLARDFSDLLNNQCVIQTDRQGRAKWERSSLDARPEFFLWQKNGTQHNGQRSGGRGTCPIVASGSVGEDWNGEYAWVAWRDTWKRMGHDTFSLWDASFTFFWGSPPVQALDNQLFRAEWPQEEYASDRAGHPHWQIDWPLANLEQVVSGLHFGMAGWECKPHPKAKALEPPRRIQEYLVPWRRFVQDDWNELKIWANRTLEYALGQIIHFFPEPFS